MAGIEVAAPIAGLACCCAVAAIYSYRQRQQQQSLYEALGMRDVNEGEEEEEYEDGASEEEEDADEEDDFLQVESSLDAQQQAATDGVGRALLFTIDDGVNGNAETPSGSSAADAADPSPGPPSVTLSAASASWVDEMNAELAEFDDVIGNLRRQSGNSGSGSGSKNWSQQLVDEELATPPPGR